MPLTGADILRIERDLGLTFEDFVCRWADPDGKIARHHAPRFRFSDEPHTPFVICLRHTSSVFLPGTTKCRFLTEGAPDPDHLLGQARCAIYGSRPGACRTFPLRLNETAELAVIHDVPERGRPGPHPAYSLCPRPWEPTDVDPLQTPQDLVVARYEMAFFSQLADLWNREPRAWNIFPDFVRLAYSQRVLPHSRHAEWAEETSPTLKFPAHGVREERQSA